MTTFAGSPMTTLIDLPVRYDLAESTAPPLRLLVRRARPAVPTRLRSPAPPGDFTAALDRLADALTGTD